MKRSKRIGRIEDDTPILPHVVADVVISEVERCFPLKMSDRESRALADKLADRADRVYQVNEQFRRQIRARGDRGRDTLYAFTRHWLASELRRTRRGVFDQLPSDFRMGAPLHCPTRRPR